MAVVNDPAGILVGDTLDRWNEMEALVQRDGDVSYAQSVIGPALSTVIASWQNPSGAVTDRAEL